MFPGLWALLGVCCCWCQQPLIISGQYNNFFGQVSVSNKQKQKGHIYIFFSTSATCDGERRGRDRREASTSALLLWKSPHKGTASASATEGGWWDDSLWIPNQSGPRDSRDRKGLCQQLVFCHPSTTTPSFVASLWSLASLAPPSFECLPAAYFLFGIGVHDSTQRWSRQEGH